MDKFLTGSSINYLSLQEAAKLCNYSQEYLSLRARQGKLQALKLGRNWVTTQEWLKTYLERAEGYNNHVNNKNNKKVKKIVQSLPPANLPVGRAEVSFKNLRAGFAFALLLVLVLGSGVFGHKDISFIARPLNDLISRNSRNTSAALSQGINLEKEDFSFMFRNLKTGVAIISDTVGGRKVLIGNVSFSLRDVTAGTLDTFREYGQWISYQSLVVVEKMQIGAFTQNYLKANEFIEGKLSVFGKQFLAANNIVEKKLSTFGNWLGKTYWAVNNLLEEKLAQAPHNLEKSYLVANKFFERKISQGYQLITRPFVRAYRFITSPWQGLIPGKEFVVSQGDIEAIKSELEKLKTEPVVVKRVEVQKVVEPVKEITKEVEKIQQVTKIDDAALAEAKARMDYLEGEIGKRLYAPGGVVSQTIYMTEPVSSPKIYQENGEIVLQTLGSGNVILSAATGLQLYGQQVVIESTSQLNPLIYLASPTKINGAVTVAGALSAGDISAADISATTLTVSGNISTTGATSTFGGIETTGLKMTTGATNGYVLTSDDSGYATWQAASSGGGGGTNTWDWIVDGSVMYATSSATAIGVATSSPRHALDVWGDFSVGTSTDTNTPILYVDSGDGGRVGIGTTTLSGLLTVGTTTPSLVVAPNSYVGIGTVSPIYNLDVNGTIRGTSLTDGTFSVTGGAITGATGDISMWTNNSGYLTWANASSTYFTTSSANYWITQKNLSDLGDVDAATGYGNLVFWDGNSWDDIATSSLHISMDDLLDGTTYVRLTAVKDAYINQDVTSGSSPVFSNANMTGNISVWANNAGYLAYPAATSTYLQIVYASSTYLQISSTTPYKITILPNLSSIGTLTTAGGDVSLWTNDSGYITNQNWKTLTTTSLIPTSTIGIIVSASSTITNLTMILSTTTDATTTHLGISGVAGSIQCLQVDATGNVSGTGSACGAGTGSSNWQYTTGQTALTPTSTIGIIVNASSTFTGTTTLANLLVANFQPINRIGIATSSPRYPLDVWGDFGIGTTTSGSLSPVLYAETGNSWGVGIGTTTMTGIFNVGTSTNYMVVDRWGRIGLGTSTLVGLLTVGTSTPAFVVGPTGKVGIVSSTPSDILSVGTGLQVNSSGNITRINGITYSWPSSQGGASTYLQSDSSGNLTWAGGGSNWQYTESRLALRPTSSVGIIVSASSTIMGDLAIGTSTNAATPLLFVDTGGSWGVGIGTTTMTGIFNVGTSTNYMVIDRWGRIGLGTSTLVGLLTVGTTTPALVVDPTGKVGIATSSPRYALDVWGDFGIGTTTTSTLGASLNPVLYADTGGSWGVGIGTTTMTGIFNVGTSTNYMVIDRWGRIGLGTSTLVGLLTVGTTTPALVVDPTGKVGIATTTPSTQFAVAGNMIGSGNIILYGTPTSTVAGSLTVRTNQLVVNESGNVGIGTTTPSSKLTINESSDFAFGDFNASVIDTMEGTLADWHSNNPAYVGTSTETSIVKTGAQSLKIYASTTPEDICVKKTYSVAQNFSGSFQRLGFWIYADKIATSSATTTQIISIGIYDSANAASATTTKQIYIQEENRWQYEEWTVDGLANATSVDQLFFRIDVNNISTINFYIDQIRLYNSAERSGEMFVDKDGSLTIMGRGSVEIARASGSSNLPGIKVDSAVVELGQPLSVNTGGDVGFDYDLQFLNTGLSQITSEGPLRIAAGDSNHSENLTLTTGGTGDVIVDLTASSSSFIVNHGWSASTTIPFIINSETYATTSLDNSGTLFQIISDASTTAPGVSSQDENVVFEIDAFGGYYYDGTSHSSASDVAENYFVADESIGSGDVVCLNGAPLNVEKCSQSYQNNLIGVVSSRPALLMADGMVGSARMVALVGRIPVKVSAENGPIEIGDALTSASSVPGTAMKATGAGKILGYALEPFDSGSTETILAFINLQERGQGDLTVYQNGDGKLEVKTLTKNGLATIFSIDEEGAMVVGKLKTQELCVGSVCVTEEDFVRVFGASVAETLTPDVAATTSGVDASVCENGANRPCSSEVGACQIGVEICENGVWGECIGAAMPSQEICDGVDNDCDGEIDEDVCEAPAPEATTTDSTSSPQADETATTTSP